MSGRRPNPESLLSQEAHYRLLKALENNPSISQRELSRTLEMSLGKVNYCLKALISKGLVKANNFKNSQNKMAYAYVLTPRGLKSKAEVTLAFLKRKQSEIKAIQSEIDQLREEVKTMSHTSISSGQDD